MLVRFCIYGFLGLFLEIMWTSLMSFLDKDYRLIGRTSVWMFFIYGSALFFEPVCILLAPLPTVVRGAVYALIIFAFEYAAGLALSMANICPWDYSTSRYNINGIIRLDYAPLWFGVGLLFEGICFLLISFGL